MNKELAQHIKSVRKSNDNEDIVLIMHMFKWVNTFKCLSSFNDADIYPRVDVDLVEITILPKDLYFSEKGYKSIKG